MITSIESMTIDKLIELISSMEIVWPDKDHKHNPKTIENLLNYINKYSDTNHISIYTLKWIPDKSDYYCINIWCESIIYVRWKWFIVYELEDYVVLWDYIAVSWHRELYLYDTINWEFWQ